ncbi:cation diffusion facilitator family transporter, partial [Anoxybacillus geothermalis]|nr:cation diffusion facilitator family transporter [Anoxybacillus geothermalis]
MNGVERKQRAEAGVLLSLFIYLLLAAGKLLAGAAAGSDGVKADGWNNLSDVMASVAVYIGMKIAKKPRDRNHPYGHSRAENISSLLAAFFMMSIGIDVITDGARTLLGGGREAAPDWLAAAAALASAAVMFIIYVLNVRLARRTYRMALAAVAKGNLSDVLVSSGAGLGIVGALLAWAGLVPWAA